MIPIVLQNLMLIFTNEDVLIDYGVRYLRIAGFSYLLTGISQCYLVIMKTSEHAKTTAAISSATACVWQFPLLQWEPIISTGL